MDRALKERIIGAVVLVAIAVLVVPVFLDGPEPETQMISEPVLLPGQSREPGERRTVVLERDRDQPLPETPAQPADRPTQAAAGAGAAPAKPQPGGSEPENDAGAGGTGTTVAAADPKREEPAKREAPPPAETAPAAPAGQADGSEPAESPTGMWAVQIGSFSNKANADRLAAQLREEGYAAFLSRHSTASGELHRVRIGPQDDRASAEAVAAKLRAEGLKGQVVPHP